MNQRTDEANAQEGFDPLAYIESAFSDTKREKPIQDLPDDLEVELPTIGQFLGTRNGSLKAAAKSNSSTTVEREAEAGDTSKIKFRKRKLSAPRPRKVKMVTTDSPIDAGLEEVWSSLPRNIHFLSSFFDDKVTSNYYRGDFRESRQDLIRRLLDPELSLEEVSRLLGVCPATVRRYTNREWLSHHRTQGGQRRFRLSGVVKFVEEHGRHPEE